MTASNIPLAVIIVNMKENKFSEEIPIAEKWLLLQKHRLKSLLLMY